MECVVRQTLCGRQWPASRIHSWWRLSNFLAQQRSVEAMRISFSFAVSFCIAVSATNCWAQSTAHYSDCGSLIRESSGDHAGEKSSQHSLYPIACSRQLLVMPDWYKLNPMQSIGELEPINH